MAIPETAKPDACTCDWEEVTELCDPETMIERTGPDLLCPTHPPLIRGAHGDTP
ncbi:hypothetical protein GCM10023081_46850 [Arthrobacter ginkgonis]|uniref:Uncharacterized protein n=1 Tax=Arthrobacter ginkgonis TaxID=1630594 RepID=A0ABP7DJY1_9MICC